MKQLISIFLIFTLILSLSACKVKTPNEEAFNIDEPLNTENAGDNTEKSEDIQQNSPTAQNNNETNIPKTEAPETETEDSPENDLPNTPQPEKSDDNSNSEKPVEEDERKQQDSTATQTNKKLNVIITIDKDPPAYTPEQAKNIHPASDCFIGKIIDAEKIEISEEIIEEYAIDKLSENQKDNRYFILNPALDSVVFPLNAELYLYTVEVEKTFYSVFAEENTKIKVLADVSDMTEEYEINKRYIMKGVLYEYGNRNVLRLYDHLTARVEEGDTLVGIAADAEIFNTLKTVDDFVNNEYIKELFAKKFNALSEEFKVAYGMERWADLTAEENKDKFEKLITDGKKAILADSEFKMNLTPNQSAS